VIRNGYVITMDARGTRYTLADIAVQQGSIVSLGPSLDVLGKE
jgi:hypothetical protein